MLRSPSSSCPAVERLLCQIPTRIDSNFTSPAEGRRMSSDKRVANEDHIPKDHHQELSLVSLSCACTTQLAKAAK
ncbi:hypothetical protein IAQ61_001871 [Plenodomus lingam]|uniref:uncharacterized protein n=1 Tax=Leptosphaeria maculans TaxID=5022 RepID=UPI003322864A|nr:hypothetical protein IAQ61_001871 [Plenodomus lingam]